MPASSTLQSRNTANSSVQARTVANSTLQTRGSLGVTWAQATNSWAAEIRTWAQMGVGLFDSTLTSKS